MTTTKPENLHGVYLDPEAKISTMDIPHHKIKRGADTWYVAKMPEGDYIIHEHLPRYQQGYGGSMVTFLLDDGTYETVKGPFSRAGAFDHGALDELAKHGFKHNGQAFKLIVGTGLWPYSGGDRNVVHEEPELAVGRYKERLAALIDRALPDGWEVELRTRCGGRYLRQSEVYEELKPKESP
jgi:hypothetical protein